MTIRDLMIIFYFLAFQMGKVRVLLRIIRKKRRRQMIKIFLINQLDQVESNRSDFVMCFCYMMVDEDMDEEDESDNDHPGSDPDFAGGRRIIPTK